MLYTKTCEYALRVLVYLSLKEGDELVKSALIGKEARVPEAYTSKIFRRLVQAEILVSKPGPKGGVAYAKPPAKVSLFDVIQVIDDASSFDDCVMGLERCTEKLACPLHYIWKDAKEEMILKLKNTTILDLSKKADRFNYRELSRLRLKEV